MLGLNERVKSGVKLATAVMKKVAIAYDEAAPTSTEPPSQPAGPETDGAPPPPVRPRRELNLRALLDRLSIRTIELQAGALHRLLRNYVLIGPRGGLCGSTAEFASQPARWTSDPVWVGTILANARVWIEKVADAPRLRVDIPHANFDSGGRVGGVIDVGVSQLDKEYQVSLSRRQVHGDPKLLFQVQYQADIRQHLLEYGVQATESALPAFVLSLQDAQNQQCLFALKIILIEGTDE
jgi:hypothetical protein